MSRSTNFKIKLCLAFILLFALACDLTFLRPAATPGAAGTPLSPLQFPGPSASGTPVPFRPSAAGWIAFVYQNNLWLIHPDGSGPKQITQNPTAAGPGTGAGDWNLHWSPDGQMLAYSEGGVLSVLNISSLATTVLASATAGGFDWSANGQQIIYDGPLWTGASGRPPNNGLWVTDVTSGETVSVAESSSTTPAMVAPLWSFDSSRVIFSEPEQAQPGGIHLLNLETNAITDLMPGSSKDATCSWSPVEVLIVCLDGSPPQGQTPSVILLNQNGSQTRTIPLPAGHFHASLGPWSLDGKRLAVVYSTDAGGSQWVTDALSLDSSEFKTIGPGRASGWSPDGRWIVTEGSAGSNGQAPQPIMVINTTSALSSTLSDGSSAVWQGSAADTGVVTVATQQAYCLSTAVGFVYRKPKGHFLEFCIGAKRYNYGALAEGVYAMGPKAAYFVYVSDSGFIFAARMGDPWLTRVGNVKQFIAVRTDGMVPNFQIRFLTGYPRLVQIVELNFKEKETFTLPPRITAP